MFSSASSVDLLLSLPSGVIHDILTCWLELKSVCKLDSAYCATQKRARFVELCQEKVVVFTPKYLNWIHIYWILSKKLHVSNVNLPEKLAIPFLCTQFLQMTGPHIKTLNLPRSYFSSAIWLSCFNLVTLKLSHCTLDGLLFKTLHQRCASMECLHLDECTFTDEFVWSGGTVYEKMSSFQMNTMNEDILGWISRSYPNLTALDCSHSTNIKNETALIQCIINCPKICEVNASIYCLTDAFLLFLADNRPLVRKLDIWRCFKK